MSYKQEPETRRETTPATKHTRKVWTFYFIGSTGISDVLTAGTVTISVAYYIANKCVSHVSDTATIDICTRVYFLTSCLKTRFFQDCILGF